jgi:hypothetical protein
MDALSERAAEDGEEEDRSEDRRQDRLRPEREHASRFAAGECCSSAALADAELGCAHRRIAST